MDLGPELFQRGLPAPDQQQTQQTFHFQLRRLAYPNATNIEAVAAVCGQGRHTAVSFPLSGQGRHAKVMISVLHSPHTRVEL